MPPQSAGGSAGGSDTTRELVAVQQEVAVVQDKCRLDEVCPEGPCLGCTPCCCYTRAWHYPLLLLHQSVALPLAAATTERGIALYGIRLCTASCVLCTASCASCVLCTASCASCVLCTASCASCVLCTASCNEWDALGGTGGWLQLRMW
jgi:hypothetical protein